MLEDFFLKKRTIKFEAWQAGLFSVFAILGLIWYGSLVYKGATDYKGAGLLSKTALKIAQLPADTQEVVTALLENTHPDLAWEQRFPGEAGFWFSDTYQPNDDLLLLARFDGTARKMTVEVVDLQTGDVLHTFDPDIKALGNRLLQIEKTVPHRDPGLDIPVAFRPSEYGAYHPYIEADGGLVFKDHHTPLIKIDACSKIEWALYGGYHHSLERDLGGDYWTILRQVPPVVDNVLSDFEEDTIVSVSSTGEVLYQKPLSEILIENGLRHLVYPHFPYNNDPFHLNDVQPVLEDGPYWNQGDLFLSLRHRSTIIQFRPSTNKIIWIKQGPWMAQHDVDIINDHQISIFSNNTATGHKAGLTKYGKYVLGSNETLIYDFETSETSSPYKLGFEQHDIRTISEGLIELLPDGSLFVEEQNFGRLLVMDENGETRWSYVNRADDGLVYQLHWSRYIGGEQAVALRQKIAEGFSCNDEL